MKRLALGIVVFFAAQISFANLEFHLRLLERGMASYAAGDHTRAVRELHLAAFGFLEALPQYETAQVYLALSHQALGNTDDARKAIANLLRAEQVRPTYRALQLNPAVKSSFEQVFSRLVPETRLPGDAGAVAQQPGSPGVSRPPEPSPQSPPPAPGATTGSATSPKPDDLEELEALLQKEPDSIPVLLALAEAHLRRGNGDRATAHALRVLEREPGNATAHIYLGRISAGEGRWNEAAEHFITAQSLLPLSDEDQASLFVCYVNAGKFPSALQLEGQLPATAGERKDVSDARQRLREQHDYSQHSASGPAPPSVPAKNPPRTPVPQIRSSHPLSADEIFAMIREARDLSGEERCDQAIAIYSRILENQT
ncbi:MAG TPA: tetratricopeptide repeat protein, partial [Thermoanaerobaculia bacterium]|nr:tetratricopeptide repeat protein [Thermoanaerobaculia bacterium]